MMLVIGGAASLTYAQPYFQVPADVSELKAERLNGVIFRYIEFFDYPCLRLETLALSEGSLSVDAQKDICSLTPKGEDPITFKKNVTSVVSDDIKEQDASFSFRAEYVLAEVSAPIFYTDCNVKVETTGALGEVKCGPRKQLDLDAE
ncbi:hypothetical protein ACMDCT_12310 [Halomonadaceae bacterium KBTZ08]